MHSQSNPNHEKCKRANHAANVNKMETTARNLENGSVSGPTGLYNLATISSRFVRYPMLAD
jgi:hypothetical protein